MILHRTFQALAMITLTNPMLMGGDEKQRGPRGPAVRGLRNGEILA